MKELRALAGIGKRCPLWLSVLAALWIAASFNTTLLLLEVVGLPLKTEEASSLGRHPGTPLSLCLGGGQRILSDSLV